MSIPTAAECADIGSGGTSHAARNLDRGPEVMLCYSAAFGCHAKLTSPGFADSRSHGSPSCHHRLSTAVSIVLRCHHSPRLPEGAALLSCFFTLLQLNCSWQIIEGQLAYPSNRP